MTKSNIKKRKIALGCNFCFKRLDKCICWHKGLTLEQLMRVEEHQSKEIDKAYKKGYKDGVDDGIAATIPTQVQIDKAYKRGLKHGIEIQTNEGLIRIEQLKEKFNIK